MPPHCIGVEEEGRAALMAASVTREDTGVVVTTLAAVGTDTGGGLLVGARTSITDRRRES